MDIQAPPGYFMKLVGDIPNTTAEQTNSNENIDSPVTYLLSLEQIDGTSQVVQLITEEEAARCYGMISSGTSENTTNNSTTNPVETTENVTKSVEATNSVEPTNVNVIKQPAKNLDKGAVRHKKVGIKQRKISKEKQTEVNLLPYSPPGLTDSSTCKILQFSGIALNSAKSEENVPTNSVNVTDVNVVKHPMKVSKQAVAHRKKVSSNKKNASTSIHGKTNQKQKQAETNLLSYSSTMLQANPLGIFSNGLPANGISNITSKSSATSSGEAIKNAISNSTEANANPSKHLIKNSNKALAHRKKIIDLKKNIAVDGSDKNSKEKQTEVSLHAYSTSGNSQVVQLTKDEAKALGIISNSTTNSIEVSKNIIRNAIETINNKPVKPPLKFLNKAVSHRKVVVSAAKNPVVNVCSNSSNGKQIESIKPLGSSENPIEIIKDGEVLHSTQNLSQDYLQQIADALQFKAIKSEKEEEETASDKSSNVIYRVVYPEELDLNPKPKLPKRGRPKKRLHSNCSEEKPELLSEEPKPTKNMRTRSGRITRPPQHIKKDFKKIDTSEVDNMETDLKTVEFEPLKTNQPPTTADTPVKINQLENHQRKRSIASQFRCPKCKKAYLGHTKMLKHLQKHPDHGPIPEHCKLKDDETWKFLIDLCNKNPVGQRGLKFCKELANFLHNVRMLAKIFFKRPMGIDKNLYFVDSTLSNVLNIESGNYVLNESELHTEVNMLSFINSKRFKNGNVDSSENVNDNAKNHNESFDLDAFVQKCQTDDQNLEEISHENLTFVENGHHNALNGDSHSDFNAKLDSNETNKDSKTNDTNFHQNKLSFHTIQSSEHNHFNLNCDITSVRTFNSELQKFEEHIITDFTDRSINENCDARKSPQLDINNSTSQAQENDHGKSMNTDLSLHSELLSDNSLLTSLPNLRTSVEELMLNNVDSTQVTNLLDNSTSSDEVMNVDQFVNERFKNLTESDLELPNTSLNLDLPSLDLFQFHTS